MDACRFLDWDSKFFRVRVARVNSQVLTSSLVDEIFAWCNAQQITCLYFLAAVNDDQTVKLAEVNDFHLVDLRITLNCKLAGGEPKKMERPEGGTVRLVRTDDLPILRQVARSSYSDSRFFYDENFDRKLCADLYDIWLQKSCADPAQAVWVGEVDHQPAGYITCQIQSDMEKPTGVIGLLGIGETYRSHGVGHVLVDAALDWFSQRGASQALVVTQGRNLPAQRLYQRCGFQTSSVQLWYHKWFV